MIYKFGTESGSYPSNLPAAGGRCGSGLHGQAWRKAVSRDAIVNRYVQAGGRRRPTNHHQHKSVEVVGRFANALCNALKVGR